MMSQLLDALVIGLVLGVLIVVSVVAIQDWRHEREQRRMCRRDRDERK